MFRWMSRRTFLAPRPRILDLEALEDRVVPTVGTPFDISVSALDDKQVVTASSANGTSVVVWARENTADNGTFDIRAQRYNANQEPDGMEIVVTATTFDEFDPEVAMDDAGNFVVVWTRNFTGNDLDVFYTLYEADGDQVMTGRVASGGVDEEAGAVAMSDAGTFVVTYTRTGVDGDVDVFGQRFTATGTKIGSVFNVATRSDRDEFDARIDMTGNGKFAVSYLEQGTATMNGKLKVARFGANAGLKDRTNIFTSEPGDRPSHDVAMTDAGKCIVVYNRGLDEEADEIFLRKLSVTGTLSTARMLTTASSEDGTLVRVALDRSDEDFALSYQREINNEQHVFVKEFNKDGTLKTNGEQDLGANTKDGSISIDGMDRYFAAYATTVTATNSDLEGVFGVLG